MKKNEILVGNNLIAEFMGAINENGEYDLYSTPAMNHIFESVESDDDEARHYFIPEALKFDKSWDWLMPVVEKIEMQLLDDDVITIEYKDCIIPIIHFPKGHQDVIATTGDTKIEAVWLACVQYIKWKKKNEHN